MNNDVVISVEHVSKKYCKSLKRSMLYGMMDIGRNMLGRSSRPDVLRKDEFWALDDVSFEVKKGETLGIIGPNGSGKTTLLKLLNGIFWPDKGKITIRGKVGALIELGAGFHPLLTGRENIYINAAILGMRKKEVEDKLDAIIDFAGVGDFIDTPVKYYSSGMFVRLGFAIAAHCEPDILLVDEVLAVGDEGFQTRCFNKLGALKREGTTTILVSHNMQIISSFSDKVVSLDRGKAKYFHHVPEAIKDYTRLFLAKGDGEIEKISSGNRLIQFYDVKINGRMLKPGDCFLMSASYESADDFEDVDIDIAILCGSDPGFYFQATNKAYGKKISFRRGKGTLRIEIMDLRLNHTTAKIAIAIWSKERADLLFWWRIPLDFEGAAYSTGRNFLDVTYEVGE